MEDMDIVIYNEWIFDNSDMLIEAYLNSLDEDEQIDEITIDDVPDDFLSEQYELYLEIGGDEE